jgi:hypothetical protein
MKRGWLFLFVMMAVLAFVFAGWSDTQENANPKEIVESVEVNWWQVPIFAVDKEDNPVLDLKDTDLEIWMNNHPVEAFTFYKREFMVSPPKEGVPQKNQVKQTRVTPPPPPLKKNTIFLLFDVAMSAQVCTDRSREIAKKIVTRAEPGVEFVILTIEPFKGLNYVCGPSADQTQLLEDIDKKVVGKPNLRTIEAAQIFMAPVQPSRQQLGIEKERQDEGSGGHSDQVAAYFLRKSNSFFNAFESLYLVFNSMEDNKFVYFFTEGISNSFVKALGGGLSLYNFQLGKLARRLGRSGSVLFIVNPMGVGDFTELMTANRDANSSDAGSATSYFDRQESLSGEDGLKYLAKQSGGKYLEGVTGKIVAQLEQMHRAYYEISFPDLPGLRGTTRDITVKSRRKGVVIHSLRSLEKSKTYSQMSAVEKEMAALNLITLNPLLNARFSCQHARVTKIKKNRKNIVYTVILPKEFLNQHLDLYKFWVKEDQELSRIENESLRPRKNKIKILFEMKEKQSPGLNPYFALVNGETGSALVRAIGDEWVDPEDQEELQTQKIQTKNETIPAEELQELLYHAAEYCEKLKASAFHFYCKEKIVESWKSIISQEFFNSPDIGTQSNRRLRFLRNLKLYGNVNTSVNVYTFSYRLLKNGAQIKEEREWLSSKDNVPKSREQVVKPTAFFSQRAVFAPLTLLAHERQDKYDFRFIGFDKRKGRQAFVIEGTPKRREEANSLWGKVWIDSQDYSILKIEAAPESITGYQALKEIEKQLSTRLALTLAIDFDELHGGIRFPTHIQMLEKYRGGRYVSMCSGPAGWERNRTVFTYSDYQFFDVNVEVSLKE